ENFDVVELRQNLFEDAASASLVVDDQNLHATLPLLLGGGMSSGSSSSARAATRRLPLVRAMSRSGTDTVKTVFAPSRAASMAQPWARTRRLVMARPSPVPRGLVV